jgi:hypothetical protein
MEEGEHEATVRYLRFVRALAILAMLSVPLMPATAQLSGEAPPAPQ